MEQQVYALLTEAAWLLFNLITIIMVPVLCVGLIVGVFQAATQIQEMTLSFIPKIMIFLIVMTLFGSYMVQEWLLFANKLFAFAMEV